MPPAAGRCLKGPGSSEQTPFRKLDLRVGWRVSRRRMRGPERWADTAAAPCSPVRCGPLAPSPAGSLTARVHGGAEVRSTRHRKAEVPTGDRPGNQAHRRLPSQRRGGEICNLQGSGQSGTAADGSPFGNGTAVTHGSGDRICRHRSETVFFKREKWGEDKSARNETLTLRSRRERSTIGAYRPHQRTAEQQ